MHWLLAILILPYFILLLRIFRNLAGIMPEPPYGPANNFVSVVIACKNEEKNLSVILNDIASQDYGQDNYELIIVNDNSTDGTYEAATRFGCIRHLKIINNEGHGKKSAVVTGVAASSGDLLLTTDADCRMGKNWISTIAGFQNYSKAEMAICPVVLETGQGFFQKFQELEFLSLQGVTAGTAAAGNPVMCNGANLAFTKASFTRQSGKLHDELLSGDDIFLLQGIKMDRGRITWLESENACVTTKLCDTFVSLLKQRARWISKARSYSDRYSKLLAVVTFLAIFAETAALAAGIFRPDFLLVFLLIMGLKSIPDYLILKNVAKRRNRKDLLKWFLPSAIMYPFYVACTSILSVFRRRMW